MGRVTEAQIDDLSARLERAGLHPAWRRAVRMGVRAHGECEIQVDGRELPDGTTEQTWVVVRLAGKGEGPADALVADIQTTDGNGTARASRVVKATSDRSAGDSQPRRSIRLSDEVWTELALYGDPSSVARDLIDDGLERRRTG